MFYHGLKKTRVKGFANVNLEKIVFTLLVTQIIFSFLKLAIIGFQESIVGSVLFGGGGVAVNLPLLGYLYVFLKRQGNLKLSDWLFVLGLLFVAIVSEKRSTFFILPVLLAATLIYVKRSRAISLAVIKFFPVIILVVYVGFRAVPTLNPDGVFGGRFDLEHAFSYGRDYYFGSERLQQRNPDILYGRGSSALVLITNPGFFNYTLKEYLFGHGVHSFYAKSYADFDADKHSISFKGAVGGGFAYVISFGYLGMLFYFLFGIAIVNNIKNKRFRFVVAGLYVWEFFFHANYFLGNAAMALLFIIVCLKANDYIPAKVVRE